LIDHIRARGGRVGLFPITEGSWVDIGTWDEYRRAASRLGVEGSFH
jgi:hypothetical protein